MTCVQPNARVDAAFAEKTSCSVMIWVALLVMTLVDTVQSHECIHDQIASASQPPVLVSQKHIYPSDEKKRADGEIFTQPMRILTNIGKLLFFVHCILFT